MLPPLEKLTANLQQIVTASGIPCLGAVLSGAGSRHYASAGADETHPHAQMARHGRFKIGCMMKMLLAIVALENADRKTLDLDAPIERYLPELAGSDKGREIEVRHLLSHTSGYREFDYQYQSQGDDFCDWNEFVELLLRTPRIFAPGAVYNYQHSEAILLKTVLERITRRAFDELLQEVIFQPLGIAPGPCLDSGSSGFDVQGHSFEIAERRFVRTGERDPKHKSTFWAAAVSHKTLSLTDWICIAEALIDAAHGSGSPFSKYTASRLATRVIDVPQLEGGALSGSFPCGYGAGVPLFRHGNVGHDTSLEGQTLGLRVDLPRRVAFAVGMNADRPLLRLLAMDCVMKFVYGPKPPEPPAHRHDIAAAELAGLYDGGSAGDADIALHGNRLKLTLKNANDTAYSSVLILDEKGALHSSRPMASPSIAFFRDPISRRVCLMVGSRALVKT